MNPILHANQGIEIKGNNNGSEPPYKFCIFPPLKRENNFLQISITYLNQHIGFSITRKEWDKLTKHVNRVLKG